MLRTPIVTAAAVAAAVVLAACGGSGGPNNSNNSSSSANSGSINPAFRADELKVARCIRAHGVPNYPDPSSSGGFQSQTSNGSVTVNDVKLDASPRTVQNAQKACAKYAPVGPAVSATKLASIKQGAVKLAECMRANGVPNFADPTVKTGPGGHGVGISIGTPSGGNINIYSPAFKAAMTKCRGLVPKP